MAARRVFIKVSWGEVPLASVRADLPARVDRVIAGAGVSLEGAVSCDGAPSGRLELRVGQRLAAVSDRPGAAVACRIGDLTVRVEPAQDLGVLPARRGDSGWWSALAVSLLLVAVGTFALLRSAESDEPDGRGRTLAILSRLAARTARAPNRTPAGPTQPVTATRTDDPSDDLPDDRAVRSDASPRRVTPEPNDATAYVAQRGILGLNLFSAPTLRALRNARVAFGTMNEPPVQGSDATDDRFHYGAMGALGTGFGSGCAPGTDCGIVVVRIGVGDGWRPRASTIAHAAMQARSAGPAPVMRIAPPEMGVLDMSYVQRRIRHDLLAEVVHCYDDRLEQTPDLPSGRVIVRFEIGTDGRVHAAHVVSTAIGQPEIEGCILRVIRNADFPTNETGATVTYPFVFSSLMPDR